jgi:3-methyladenine DNA glycosylase/8-oxoguanine DNA glycosylase
MSPRCDTSSVTGTDGVVRRWRPGWEIDLAAVLAPLRHGGSDPTHRRDRTGAVWRTSRTPDGPATTALRLDRSAGVVEATAWGPGADWSLVALPDLLGGSDDPAGFEPRHPVLREVHRRHAGWRVPRSRRVLESLVPAVIEQKVTGKEAFRAFRDLVRRFGEPAPGPVAHLAGGLFVQPSPRDWARIPSWDWHRAGVDLSRSRAVVTAAGSAGRLEQLVDVDRTTAATRLQSLPGVGIWTAAETAQRSLGDADAVSVGDYHLASAVGVALVGAPVDDDAMLELLEPYRGHRYRVQRLVELSGLAPARRGPRFAGRDYRAM